MRVKLCKKEAQKSQSIFPLLLRPFTPLNEVEYLDRVRSCAYLVSTIEVSCIQITFLVTDEFSMYLNTFCDKVRWSMLVAMVLFL